MKIKWHTDLIGSGKRKPAPVWPEGWPVPRVGDNVTVGGREQLEVTSVDWYPQGDTDDNDEPFVYVVLH